MGRADSVSSARLYHAGRRRRRPFQAAADGRRRPGRGAVASPTIRHAEHRRTARAAGDCSARGRGGARRNARAAARRPARGHPRRRAACGGELVRHAQAARVQHVSAVHHDRVVQAAAAASPALRSCSMSAAEREGAGRGDLVAEAVGGSRSVKRLPADRGGGKSIDSSMREPGAAGAQFGNASPSVTRTGRRISITRRGASCSTVPAQSSRKTRGRPSRRGSALPGLDLDQSVVDAAPGEGRHRCSTVPTAAAAWPGRQGRCTAWCPSLGRTGRDLEAEIGAAETMPDPPRPAESGDAAARNARRRRRSRSRPSACAAAPWTFATGPRAGRERGRDRPSMRVPGPCSNSVRGRDRDRDGN